MKPLKISDAETMILALQDEIRRSDESRYDHRLHGVLLVAHGNCFDAMTTWNFLCLLRQRSRRAGRRVVVITDNAKYHHAKLHAEWRAEQDPEFVLSYLPPYSPDLNPIERVWKLTRRLCLHNRYFPTLTGVVEAVERQFADWKQPNESLRRLCCVA
ncbi:MAG TPA: transposase [Candidatus Paceibacterota bacterium]|nr:transposase [Candidatus Paceibacterota bacterium]